MASKRAVIYTRISQDQVGDEKGIKRQNIACRKLVEARGYELVGELSDNSLSASDMRLRPAWENALNFLRTGRADVIVATELDRVTRHPLDVEDLIKLSEKTGGAVVLTSGELDLTTTDGQLLARMLVAVAAAEVKRKADRQRRANQQKALSGGRTKGVRPFGFEADGVTVREEEAAAIVAAAETVVAGGSLTSIAKRWREAGLHPSQKRTNADGEKVAGEWSVGGVRYVLKSPRYAGKRAYTPKVGGKYLKDQTTVVDAEWPAILDEDLFRAVQARLSDPARLVGKGYTRVGKKPHTTLLASLARCGACDAGRARANTRSSGVEVYTCRKCHGFSIPREDADSAVIAAFEVWADRDTGPELTEGDAPDMTEMSLRAMRDQLIARRTEIGVSLGAGRLPLDLAESAIAAVEGEIADVEARMTSADGVTALQGLRAASSPREWWKALPLARQRDAVQLLMNVRLHPQGRGGAGFKPEQVRVEYLK